YSGTLPQVPYNQWLRAVFWPAGADRKDFWAVVRGIIAGNRAGKQGSSKHGGTQRRTERRAFDGDSADDRERGGAGLAAAYSGTASAGCAARARSLASSGK